MSVLIPAVLDSLEADVGAGHSDSSSLDVMSLHSVAAVTWDDLYWWRVSHMAEVLLVPG